VAALAVTPDDANGLSVRSGRQASREAGHQVSSRTRALPVIASPFTLHECTAHLVPARIIQSGVTPRSSGLNRSVTASQSLRSYSRNTSRAP
jgi:hypothetical protein